MSPTWAPTAFASAHRHDGQCDPKKYLEMLRRNPQLSREEFEFLQSARHADQRDRHVRPAAASRCTAARKSSEGVELHGRHSPNIGGDHQLRGGRGPLPLRYRERAPHECRVHRQRYQGQVLSRRRPRRTDHQVEGVPFEVVGVAKAKGSVFGQSQDNFVMIPVETYFKIWGARNGMDYAAVGAGPRPPDAGAGRSAHAAARLPPPAAQGGRHLRHARLRIRCWISGTS